MMERLEKEMKWISPMDPAFCYEGRIDMEDPEAPTFVYPASFVRFRFCGNTAALAIENHRSYFENTLGVLVDGEYRGKIVLHDGEKLCGETAKWYLLRTAPQDEAAGRLKDLADGKGKELSENLRFHDLTPFLDGKEHEYTIFKRMDACHYFTFHGLIACDEELGREKQVKPGRRIEVYGDSISCGEVSEAIACCGGDDPQGHEGIYSNSFYSYPWILARRLNARLHDVAQGGIALQDGKGYFDMPNTKGMLSSFDKIQNNPSLGIRKQWDFERFVPHVVIVAIGQNDAHPENYMAENYEGEQAKLWRKEYAGFLGTLREKYPKALILATTTILGHDPAWDRAIGQVCEQMHDPKIKQFLYTLNGRGTSGHVRRPEAEQMASELGEFIESFGEGIWED